MKLPGGCGERSGKVVKWERALHGRKQAYQQWSVLLCTILFLDKFSMGQCRTDPSVFRKIENENVVLFRVDVP